jgi:hypothetical protein|tara:strand:- start:228 stop:539 length:312 start_codon:yes stop_codon:yes gene_type:complete
MRCKEDNNDDTQGIDEEAEGYSGDDVAGSVKGVESTVEGEQDAEEQACQDNPKTVAFGGDLVGVSVNLEDEDWEVLFAANKTEGGALPEEFEEGLAPLSGKPS